MKDLRLRPDNNYIKEASWEELYHLTQHWQSEMEFYRDEIHFIYKLISKFFNRLLEQDDFRTLQLLIQKISDTEEEFDEVEDNILEHLKHFEALIRNEFTRDEQLFRSEHEELENRVASLTNYYRLIKKEVFTITEAVLKSDKMKHLLTM